MQKTNVFLLDFNPASGLGSALREILKPNSTPPSYPGEAKVISLQYGEPSL
jgi:hypothetical protein